jgi:3-dehydroquinate synthase
MQIQSLDSIIYVGNTFDSLLTKALENVAYSSVFLVTDTNTHAHCLPLLMAYDVFKNIKELILEPGEEHKNIETTLKIWTFFSENGADRSTLVFVLGGGVLCDMAGFAAATFKRGMKFITIPTTLLSQVDASIGGKLGIDLNGLKNEIGMFKTPINTIIYPEFLKTLPNAQIISGFAEMIKHALIYGGEHLAKVKNFDILNFDFAKLSGLITKSILIKNDIVHRDPKEKNVRKILNFGHTFGHAFESFMLKKDTPILHGMAVAHGMIAEMLLSRVMLNTPDRSIQEYIDYIKSIYQPIQLGQHHFEELYKLMLHDKKNEMQEVQFALLRAPGQVEINMKCSKDQIAKAYDDYLSFFV